MARKIDTPFKIFGKKMSLLEAIVLAGGAGLGWHFLNGWIQEQKLNNLTNEFGNNLESQQAIAILQALNPSGVSWMSSMDGTNVEALHTIASQIKDFAKVATAYSTLTKGENLVKDLQSELSPEEFAMFTNILNKKVTYVPGQPTTSGAFKYKLGETLYLKAAADIRIKGANGVWYRANFKASTKVIPAELVREDGVNCYLVNTYLGDRKINAKIYFPEHLLEPESVWKKWLGIGSTETDQKPQVGNIPPAVLYTLVKLYENPTTRKYIDKGLAKVLSTSALSLNNGNIPGIGKITDSGQLVKGGRIDQYWNKYKPDVKQYGLLQQDVLPEYISPEEVRRKFSLRSIEFGNWMTQQERADHLAAAAISMKQLAKILAIPDSYIGFGGLLSLALGARGRGPAAAHFEGDKRFIINITKPSGAGALAHEYGHALDNFLGIYSGEKYTDKYASGGHTTTMWIDESVKQGSFAFLMEKLFTVLYYADGPNGKLTSFATGLKEENDYWKRRNEVFARSFEEYVEYKGAALGLKTRYLTQDDYNVHVYPGKKLQQKIYPFMDRLVNKTYQLLKERLAQASATRPDGQPSVYNHEGKIKQLEGSQGELFGIRGNSSKLKLHPVLN